MALFAVVFAAYAYFYQAGGWNQNSRFDLTRAMVERGTASIDAYARNTGDRACRGPNGRCSRARPGVDHYYCDKAPGLSWLAIPVYAPAYWIAGGDKPGPRFLAATGYLATVFTNGVPGALAVVGLWMILGALAVPARARAALCFAYAFATLAFPYATLLYGHQLSTGLIVMSFAIAVRARANDQLPGRVALVASGLCLGWAVITEYPVALAALPIFVYTCAPLWRQDRRRIGWLILGGAIPGLLLAIYNTAVFGGPLTLAYEFSTMPHRGHGVFMGIGMPRADASWGVTFSAYRGLFYSAPWLLLAFPGWVLLWRRDRGITAVSLVICALFLWLNMSISGWFAGWAPGPRYLVPALPFFAIGVSGLILAWPERWAGWRRHLSWLAFALATGYSALLMLAATSVKPEVSDQIKRPYEQFLMERFYKGQLSVNTQSIDMPNAPERAPKQAWNIGQLLGLDGLASLLPLALLMAGGLVWLRRTLARGAKTSDAVSRPRQRRTSRRPRGPPPPTEPEASPDPPEPDESPTPE